MFPVNNENAVSAINSTSIENRFVEVNGTNQTIPTASNQTIPNQYIVILQETADNNAIQSLINDLENKGAQIVARYDELFKGFSFKTPDNQTSENITSFLQQNPQVKSLTQDREASVLPK
jgi:hypothetical protein